MDCVLNQLPPGSKPNVRKLRAAFDNGNVDFSTPEGYERDIHAVAAMIKVVEHSFASTHLIPHS